MGRAAAPGAILLLLFFQPRLSSVEAASPVCNACRVFSFGSNTFGQTGLGSDSGDTLIPTPIDTSHLVGKTVTQVAAGGAGSESHTLLLASDGTVFSFGTNQVGRTGLGITTGNTLVATPIDTTNLSGTTIIQIAASGFASFLLADDGKVFGFGPNSDIGIGSLTGVTSVATPINMTNLGGRKVVQVSAGADHTLLLADDGSVFSFGFDGEARTGLGFSNDFSATLIPTPIVATNLGGKKIKQIAAGGTQSLLLADDGTVFSFGWNGFGATGLGFADTSSSAVIATPINTQNLAGKKIKQIADAGGHSLLLADDGTVFSFGDNSQGATGLDIDTGRTSIATPISLTNLGGRKVVDLATGAGHTLLLASDGTVFSFGWNNNGRTGMGTSIGSTLIAMPIDMTNLAGLRVTRVTAGWNDSFLLAVPEPSSIALTIVGSIGGVLLLALRRRSIYHNNGC